MPRPIDIDRPTPLLGGLSPRAFMRRHWQKTPLVVRGAFAQARSLASPADIRRLAARDGVESRLVVRDGDAWSLRHGPFGARALPSVSRPGWTLLVQGADLHLDAARALLDRFRFVPDARLDDVMLSYATDGGGVGPHVDSYDVFLLQLRGRRRWRVAPPRRRARLRDDVPLRMLARLAPSTEWALDEGDCLYLPPGWQHDGVAAGETITASIGFRAPTDVALGVDVLQQLLDLRAEAVDGGVRYADPSQRATGAPARVPAPLVRFAESAVAALVGDRASVARALGAALSEPKPGVWFDARGSTKAVDGGVRLDRRTRMLYDARHAYVNGEPYRVAGRDAMLVRRLADRRALAAHDIRALTREARAQVEAWCAAGWLHTDTGGDDT
ncbi:MAG TPA: cupin domain-containing protein [Caldimonas sp.]|nr:cupin domain-containing protein [Caldimonas sp.]